MSHLTRTAAPVHHLHGVTFRSFAASHSGAAHLAAWHAEFPPSTVGTAHSMTEEEVLHVLRGRLAVELGPDSFTADAGDAVLIPAGTRFRVSNNADAPAEAWVTTTVGMNAVMDSDGARVALPWAQ